MHPGYMAIGIDDPLEALQSHEIVNNNRVSAYVAATGALPWLHDCDVCTDLTPVLPGSGVYVSVNADPAPWYNARNMDSLGFLGVMGLEVTGAEDSTRQATVTSVLRGGGVIGPTYLGPRSIIVRALAVATEECSLQYGLRWLGDQFIPTDSPCAGDPLTFFECCPSCTDEELRPVGPCWPTTYAELRDGPACDPDWWPTTYEDWRRAPPYLRTAPPTAGDWCDWPGTYYELRTWLPPWGCCQEIEVLPRMRQFSDARVTEGPTVLQRPRVSVGALAEIEFTITAAQPTATRASNYWTDTWVE